MNDPRLEFAFEINVALAPPLDGGPGRHGHRRINPITGGWVRGPRLQGRVLPGGADYEWVRANGCSVLDAHYVLQAEDGTPIYIRNQGLFIADAALLRRLDAGESVDEAAYYFRCAPRFEAPEGPHGWLSERLFFGSGAFRHDHVLIKIFEIL